MNISPAFAVESFVAATSGAGQAAGRPTDHQRDPPRQWHPQRRRGHGLLDGAEGSAGRGMADEGGSAGSISGPVSRPGEIRCPR